MAVHVRVPRIQLAIRTDLEHIWYDDENHINVCQTTILKHFATKRDAFDTSKRLTYLALLRVLFLPIHQFRVQNMLYFVHAPLPQDFPYSLAPIIYESPA